MCSRQEHSHFDRWPAPPGSASKKRHVFLWDCPRFQETWALLLSAVVTAGVRCHLLCDLTPFPDMKISRNTHHAPQARANGQPNSLPTHLRLLLHQPGGFMARS